MKLESTGTIDHRDSVMFMAGYAVGFYHTAAVYSERSGRGIRYLAELSGGARRSTPIEGYAERITPPRARDVDPRMLETGGPNPRTWPLARALVRNPRAIAILLFAADRAAVSFDQLGTEFSGQTPTQLLRLIAALLTHRLISMQDESVRITRHGGLVAQRIRRALEIHT